MRLEVHGATAQAWTEVAAVLGGPRGRPDSCWCQRFRRPSGEDHRAELCREVHDAAVPIGLVAVADGLPVGWSRVVPRHTLPGITGNRALARVLPPDDAAWWVACVVVRREARGRGIGAALLRAAVDHAAANGASVLDGHPVDVDRLASRPSAAALFTGTASMFLAAGFDEVARTAPSRPVLRRVLDTPQGLHSQPDRRSSGAPSGA